MTNLWTFLSVIFISCTIVLSYEIGNSNGASKEPASNENSQDALENMDKKILYHEEVKKLLDRYKKYDRIKLRSSRGNVDANKLIDEIRKRRKIPLIQKEIKPQTIKLNYTVGDSNWARKNYNLSPSVLDKSASNDEKSENLKKNSSNSNSGPSHSVQTAEARNVSGNSSQDGLIKLRTNSRPKLTQTSLKLENKKPLTPSKEMEDHKVLDLKINITRKPGVRLTDSNSKSNHSSSSQTGLSSDSSDLGSSGTLNQTSNSNELGQNSTNLISTHENKRMDTNKLNSFRSHISKQFDKNSSIPTKYNAQNNVTNSNKNTEPKKPNSNLKSRTNLKTDNNSSYVGNLKNRQIQNFNGGIQKTVNAQLDKSLLEPANKVMNSSISAKNPLNKSNKIKAPIKIVKNSFQIAKQNDNDFPKPKDSNKPKITNDSFKSSGSKVGDSPKIISSLQQLKSNNISQNHLKGVPQLIPPNKYTANSKTTTTDQQNAGLVGRNSNGAVDDGHRDPLFVANPDPRSNVNNNLNPDTSALYGNPRQSYNPRNSMYLLNENSKDMSTNMLSWIPNTLRGTEQMIPNYDRTSIEQHSMLPYRENHFTRNSYPIQFISPDNIIKQPQSQNLYAMFQGQLYLLVPEKQDGRVAQNNNRRFTSETVLQPPLQENTLTKQKIINDPYKDRNNMFSKTIAPNTLYRPSESFLQDRYNKQQQPERTTSYAETNPLNFPQILNNRADSTMYGPLETLKESHYPTQQQNQILDYVKPNQLYLPQNDMRRDATYETSPIKVEGLLPLTDENTRLFSQKVITPVRESNKPPHFYGQQPLLYGQTNPNHNFYDYTQSINSLHNQNYLKNIGQRQENSIDSFLKKQNTIYLSNDPYSSQTKGILNTAYPVNEFANKQININSSMEQQQPQRERFSSLSSASLAQNRPNNMEYGLNKFLINQNPSMVKHSAPSDSTDIYPNDSPNNIYNNMFISKPKSSHQSDLFRSYPEKKSTRDLPYPSLVSFAYEKSNLNRGQLIKERDPVNHPMNELYSFHSQNEAHQSPKSLQYLPLTSSSETNEKFLPPKSSLSLFSLEHQIDKDDPLTVSNRGRVPKFGNSLPQSKENVITSSKTVPQTYYKTNHVLNPSYKLPYDVIRNYNPQSYENLPTSMSLNVPTTSSQNQHYLRSLNKPQDSQTLNYINNLENQVSYQPAGFDYENNKHKIMDQFPNQEYQHKRLPEPDFLNIHHYKNPVKDTHTFVNPEERFNLNLQRNNEQHGKFVPTDGSNRYLVRPLNVMYGNNRNPKTVHQDYGVPIYQQYTNSPSNQHLKLYNDPSQTEKIRWQDNMPDPRSNQHDLISFPQFYQPNNGYLPLNSRGGSEPMQTQQYNPPFVHNSAEFSEPANSYQESRTINYLPYKQYKNNQNHYFNMPEESSSLYSYQTPGSVLRESYVDSRPFVQYSPDGSQFHKRIYDFSQSDKNPSFSGSSQNYPDNEQNTGENAMTSLDLSEPNSLNVRSIDWAKYIRPGKQVPGKHWTLDRTNLPVSNKQEPSNSPNTTAPKANHANLNVIKESNFHKPSSSRNVVMKPLQADQANGKPTKSIKRIVTQNLVRNQQLIPVETKRAQDGKTKDKPNYSSSNLNLDPKQEELLTSSRNSFNSIHSTEYSSIPPSNNVNTIDDRNQDNKKNAYHMSGSNSHTPFYKTGSPTSVDKNINRFNAQASFLQPQSHISGENRVGSPQAPLHSSPSYQRLSTLSPSGRLDYNNVPPTLQSRNVDNFNIPTSSLNVPESIQQYSTNHLKLTNKPVFINPNYNNQLQISRNNKFNRGYSQSYVQYPQYIQQLGDKYFPSMNQPIYQSPYNFNRPSTSTNNNYNSFNIQPLTFESPQVYRQDGSNHFSIINAPVPRNPNYMNPSQISEYGYIDGVHSRNQLPLNSQDSSKYPILKNPQQISRPVFQEYNRDGRKPNGIGQTMTYYEEYPRSLVSAEQMPTKANYYNNDNFQPIDSRTLPGGDSTGTNVKNTLHWGINSQNQPLLYDERARSQMYPRYTERNHIDPSRHGQQKGYYANNINRNNIFYGPTDQITSHGQNSYHSSISTISPNIRHYLSSNTFKPATGFDRTKQNIFPHGSERLGTYDYSGNNLGYVQHGRNQPKFGERFNVDYSYSPKSTSPDSARDLRQTPVEGINSNKISRSSKNFVSPNEFQNNPTFVSVNQEQSSFLPAGSSTSGGLDSSNNNINHNFIDDKSFVEHYTDLNRLQSEADHIDSYYNNLSEIFQKRIERLNKTAERRFLPIEIDQPNRNRILPRNAGIMMDLTNNKTDINENNSSPSGVEKKLISNKNSENKQKLQKDAHSSTVNQEGCLVNGTKMEVGEEWTVTGVCGVFTCLSNGVQSLDVECPKLKFSENQHCEVIEADMQLEFPLCCPHLKCTTKKNSEIKKS